LKKAAQNSISVNMKQAVPFFGVTNMDASLGFYIDGLGFKMTRWWIPEAADDHGNKPDGRIRWCWLELGEAAIMLQEFSPQRQTSEPLGGGVNVCFQCEDALALYREFKSRGIHTRTRLTSATVCGSSLSPTPMATAWSSPARRTLQKKPNWKTRSSQQLVALVSLLAAACYRLLARSRPSHRARPDVP